MFAIKYFQRLNFTSIPRKLYLPSFAYTMNTCHKSIAAVCQMTSTEDKMKNLEIVERLVKTSAQQNASIVFLPEACDYIAKNRADTVSMAEPLDGTTVSRYRSLAKEYNVWISVGVHENLPDSDNKVKNTLLMIDDKGDIVSKYSKLHLYAADLPGCKIDESNWTEKGVELVAPVQTPIGKIGMCICYDMRFPEMSLSLNQMGADILIYPSAFTFETGALHWETLLRARAIDNQCYVIASDQIGFSSPNRRTWGHSVIIDPSGIVVAQCSNTDMGSAVATIDLELVNRVRASIDLKSHRRFDIYPKLATEHSAQVDDAIPSYQFGQVVINSKTVFYKTDFTIAFVNKRCAVPGHVLVTPIRLSERLSDLSAIEVSDLFLTVQKVQSVMEKVHDTQSSTICIQDGKDAGQTIWHLHVHILPRKPNDFPDNDDIYRVLQSHTESSGWREEDVMIKEAEFLRSFF